MRPRLGPFKSAILSDGRSGWALSKQRFFPTGTRPRVGPFKATIHSDRRSGWAVSKQRFVPTGTQLRVGPFKTAIHSHSRSGWALSNRRFFPTGRQLRPDPFKELRIFANCFAIGCGICGAAFRMSRPPGARRILEGESPSHCIAFCRSGAGSGAGGAGAVLRR